MTRGGKGETVTHYISPLHVLAVAERVVGTETKERN